MVRLSEMHALMDALTIDFLWQTSPASIRCRRRRTETELRRAALGLRARAICRGCARTMLLCLSSVDFGVLEEAVDLAGDVAFEAALGFSGGCLRRFVWRCSLGGGQ